VRIEFAPYWKKFGKVLRQGANSIRTLLEESCSGKYAIKIGFGFCFGGHYFKINPSGCNQFLIRTVFPAKHFVSPENNSIHRKRDETG